MNRIVSLLLFLFLPVAAFSQSFKSGDLYYKILSPTTVEVTYYGSERPSQATYPQLTSVSIPKTVTDKGTTYNVTGIGSRAFYKCERLASVELSEGLERIGSFTFFGCDLLKSIQFPKTLKELGIMAFAKSGLEKVTMSVELSQHAGIGAFSNCLSLKRVNIESYYKRGEMTIVRGLFQNCSSLEFCSVDKTITHIEPVAFEGCKSLQVLNVEDCKEIGAYAFHGCSDVGQLKFGSDLKTIGESAFSGMSSLRKLDIPASVDSIGKNAFEGCDQLTDIGLSCRTVVEGTPFNGKEEVLNIKAPRIGSAKVHFYESAVKTPAADSWGGDICRMTYERGTSSASFSNSRSASIRFYKDKTVRVIVDGELLQTSKLEDYSYIPKKGRVVVRHEGNFSITVTKTRCDLSKGSIGYHFHTDSPILEASNQQAVETVVKTFKLKGSEDTSDEDADFLDYLLYF